MGTRTNENATMDSTGLDSKRKENDMSFLQNLFKKSPQPTRLPSYKVVMPSNKKHSKQWMVIWVDGVLYSVGINKDGSLIKIKSRGKLEGGCNYVGGHEMKTDNSMYSVIHDISKREIS